MLIAIVTVLFLGGGGATYDLFSKDAQNLILSVLDDAEQQEQVKSLMKQGAKEGKKASKELASLLKGWLKEDLEPATGRGEFDRLLVEAEKVRSAAKTSFLDVIFQLRDELTAEQWETAFGESLDGESEP